MKPPISNPEIEDINPEESEHILLTLLMLLLGMFGTLILIHVLARVYG